MVKSLGVIGNISRDRATYPDGRTHEFLGGAALHVAMAAAQSGLHAAPIAVVGTDLGWIRTDERLELLDLSAVRLLEGPSCSFSMRYNDEDQLLAIDCDFGVSRQLTDHALEWRGDYDHYHVCGRRPLDVRQILTRLSNRSLSLDFFVSSAASIITEVAGLLPHVSLIFVNAAEFELLGDVVDVADVAATVVTDGPNAVRLLRHGQLVATASPKIATPVEVTGAGDTLAGTFLACQAAGHPDSQALQRAVNRASSSVQSMRLRLRPPEFP